MLTLRQLQRLFNDHQHGRILRLCLEMRPETSDRLLLTLSAKPITASAIAVIRLDELGQPHAPLCRSALDSILRAQQADGGWGDPLASALCIRALMCSHGHGAAIDRGIRHLATLQKTDGAWPREPIRRLPADAFTSAFILFQLAADHRFAAACRVDTAAAWLASHQSVLDAQTSRLWRLARSRMPAQAHMPPPPLFIGAN